MTTAQNRVIDSTDVLSTKIKSTHKATDVRSTKIKSIHKATDVRSTKLKSTHNTTDVRYTKLKSTHKATDVRSTKLRSTRKTPAAIGLPIPMPCIKKEGEKDTIENHTRFRRRKKTFTPLFIKARSIVEHQLNFKPGCSSSVVDSVTL